jgi:hypothetical protein
MISKAIRAVFVVAVLAAVLGIAGGSSVRPALLQADGPPVIAPCPCSDARCLPLCHNVGAPSGLTPGALVASALVAMEVPPVACPCADARCLPLCQGNP